LKIEIWGQFVNFKKNWG